MDRFISKEDFLNTPKEFQYDYIKWWNPQIGDLFTWKDDDTHDSHEVNCCSSDLMVELTNKNKGIDNRIPLATLESIIDYIEYKTGFKFTISDKADKQYYAIFYDDEGYIRCRYGNLGTDLLKAHLKVAIEILEGE